MTFTRFDAISSLVGGQLAGNDDGTKVNYIDKQTPPSDAEINAELKRLEKEHSDLAYARNRKDEYPDLAEQLDLLWHAIDTGTLDDRDHRNKFYSTLKEVKTNNPKG